MNPIDEGIFEFVKESIWCDALDVVFPYITALGNDGIFWIALGVVMLFFKRTRWAGFVMLLCLAVTAIICNLGIKNLVMRPRPFIADPTIQLLIDPPSGFSFPSGHSSASAAAAMSLFLNKVRFWPLAAVLALLIAFSRIYLQVHYPTDVLVGLACGIVIATCVTFLVNALRSRVFRKS